MNFLIFLLYYIYFISAKQIKSFADNLDNISSVGSDCKTMQKLHPEMHVRCPGDPKIDKNKKVMKSDESNSDSSNKLEFGNDIDKALSSIQSEIVEKDNQKDNINDDYNDELQDQEKQSKENSKSNESNIESNKDPEMVKLLNKLEKSSQKIVLDPHGQLVVKGDEAKPADKDAVEFQSIIGDQSSIDKLGNDLMNDILGDMKKISGDEKNLNIDIKKNEEFLNKNDSGLQNLLSKLSNSKTNSQQNSTVQQNQTQSTDNLSDNSTHHYKKKNHKGSFIQLGSRLGEDDQTVQKTDLEQLRRNMEKKFDDLKSNLNIGNNKLQNQFQEMLLKVDSLSQVIQREVQYEQSTSQTAGLSIQKLSSDIEQLDSFISTKQPVNNDAVKSISQLVVSQSDLIKDIKKLEQDADKSGQKEYDLKNFVQQFKESFEDKKAQFPRFREQEQLQLQQQYQNQLQQQPQQQQGSDLNNFISQFMKSQESLNLLQNLIKPKSKKVEIAKIKFSDAQKLILKKNFDSLIKKNRIDSIIDKLKDQIQN